MRREDREIIERKELDEILYKAQVCRLAVSYEGMAYIIPMSFGYADQTLYFHSAQEGLKLLVLRENPKACFEVDTDIRVISGDKACDWTMQYKSVVGFGEVEFIEGIEAKREALRIIMQHYSEDAQEIEDSAISGVTVFKLNVCTMTGKKST